MPIGIGIVFGGAIVLLHRADRTRGLTAVPITVISDKNSRGLRYWQGVQNGPAIYLRRIDLGLRRRSCACDLDHNAPDERA